MEQEKVSKLDALNSFRFVGMLCLLLGLAPFFPEPHVWEKLKMLVACNLVKPVDIFDLLMHAAPFAVLGLKLLRMARG